MSQQRTYKRRHFFVKKSYQFKFILKFCLIVLAGSILSTGLVLLFSRGTLTSSFENSRLVVTNTASAILPLVIVTNIVTIGVITIATIVVVLFISHKIAGPLFRFEKELKEIGEGDLTKLIKLRKNDQITDMAEDLNIMTANLREKVLAIQDGVTQLLESASERNAPRGLIEDLEKLRERIQEDFKI